MALTPKLTLRRMLVMAMLVLLSALIAVSTVIASVIAPVSDRPRHVDAIVLLSGDHGERLPLAERLLQSGVAPTLVLAGTPDSVADLQLCLGGRPYEVICLRPEPDSTRAEARSTARLASARHWQTMVVVTSTPHQARAKLLFERCFTGHIEVVGADLPFGGTAARKVELHEVLGQIYARVWAVGC